MNQEFQSSKQLSLLEHLTKIVALCAKEGLSKNALDTLKPNIKAASALLSLSQMQTVLFAFFLDHHYETEISLEDIQKDVKREGIEFLQYISDIDELEKREFIFRTSNPRSQRNYRLSQEIINFVASGTRIICKQESKFSIYDLFNCVQEIFERMEFGDKISCDEFVKKFNVLFAQNDHLDFVKQIKKHKIEKVDLIILMRFFDLFVNQNENKIDFDQIGKRLFKRCGIFIGMKERDMSSGKNELIANFKFIENKDDRDKGSGKVKCFGLSQKAKKLFFKELDIKDEDAQIRKDFLLSDSLPAKKLFYSPQQAAEIEELTSLLQIKNFKNVQDRLQQSGMRKGFACLFYGAAGTGKTESVYQICKKVKRDIFVLDIAKTQSKWVGDNEKLMKKVFDDYRGAVSDGGTIPVLLFNEADALISKRFSLDSSSRNVDQMANRVQNILLQEIETLDGILIATTNLTTNLDSAFERRFIYKVEFLKPDIAARQSIWQSIIKDLDKQTAKLLSQKYAFSGGQIENIARKCCIDKIIHGDYLNIDRLKQLCNQEMLNKQNSKNIGFLE
jgi:hypothetical protein